MATPSTEKEAALQKEAAVESNGAEFQDGENGAAADRTVAPSSGGSGFRSWMTDFMNLLKAFIGLNFMYISFAFSQAGLARGCVGILFITYITYSACMMLIKVKNSLPDEYLAAHRNLTYGDIARITCGPRIEMIINGALVLTQFGYCTGYLIFLSHTIHDVLNSDLPVWGFVLMPLPILIGVAMLRSVRSLAPLSAFSNVSLMVGFGAVVAYIIMHFKFQPSTPPLSSFPIFFGQVTAALEGIGLVIPVETSMRDRKKFPGVMFAALFCLAFVLLTVGVLGFVTFGADTKSIILMNMQGSTFIGAVKLVLCMGILFTYPLQLVPVVQALENWVVGRVRPPLDAVETAGDDTAEGNENGEAADDAAEEDGDGDGDGDGEGDAHDETAGLNEDEQAHEDEHKSPIVTSPYQWVCRIMIVMGTALTAVFAGKSFGLFQSLIGSLGAAMLAYTAPAYLHLNVFKEELTLTEKLKDLMILTVGILGSAIGTGSTIREIFRSEGEAPADDAPA